MMMRVLLCDEREQQRKHKEKVKNEKEEKKCPPQKVTDGHLGEQQL